MLPPLTAPGSRNVGAAVLGVPHWGIMGWKLYRNGWNRDSSSSPQPPYWQGFCHSTIQLHVSITLTHGAQQWNTKHAERCYMKDTLGGNPGLPVTASLWRVIWYHPFNCQSQHGKNQTGQITSQTHYFCISGSSSFNQHQQRKSISSRVKAVTTGFAMIWLKEKETISPPNTAIYCYWCINMTRPIFSFIGNFPFKKQLPHCQKKPQSFHNAMEVIIIQSLKDLTWTAHNRKAFVKSENT